MSHDDVDYMRKVVRYLISLCHEDQKNLYIIEGVQLFYWFEPSEFKGKPFLILGTSAVKSSIRAYKRDKQNGNNKSGITKYISKGIHDDKYFSKFDKGLHELKK